MADQPSDTAAPGSELPGTESTQPGAPDTRQHPLEHCRGDKKRTAQMLGISLKTLYNRLNVYAGRQDVDARTM